MVSEQDIPGLLDRLKGLAPQEALAYLAGRYPAIAFSTSFGLEDQVITHLIAENNLPIRIFSLDTGRLFEQTYKTWSSTLDKYSISIDAYHAQAGTVETLLRTKGPHSFYQSIENRKECCHIRKVEPLGRALAGVQLWVTGIRADQSAARADLHPLEWDTQHQLIKFHPLFCWTLAEVEAYIQANHIPYNVLHDRGFPSIGCEPCTRAVAPGQDPRSGRWWWERGSTKECGLHETAVMDTTKQAE